MTANFNQVKLTKTTFIRGVANINQWMTEKPVSDDEAQRRLREGDSEKIDRKLDELDVSTTSGGNDQTAKPDTEGSNSSSKNLDEQDG
jgi:hypothetical protein